MELIKSGVGKTVSDLRKHGDAQIRDRSNHLRSQWKAIVVRNEILYKYCFYFLCAC